jgi:hypothetical protein
MGNVYAIDYTKSKTFSKFGGKFNMKLAKLFSISSTTLSLSGLFLAPVLANPVQQLVAQNAAPVQNVYTEGATRIGRIVELSGSTATVVFRDGSTQEIQVPADANLVQDNYIAVNDGHYDGTIRTGRIVSIVGGIITVKLDDGTLTTVYNQSRGPIDGIWPSPGQYVWITNNRIVASAANQNAYNISYVKPAAIDFSSSRTETVQPAPAPVYRPEPAPAPAPAPVEQAKPVRGMW